MWCAFFRAFPRAKKRALLGGSCCDLPHRWQPTTEQRVELVRRRNSSPRLESSSRKPTKPFSGSSSLWRQGSFRMRRQSPFSRRPTSWSRCSWHHARPHRFADSITRSPDHPITRSPDSKTPRLVPRRLFLEESGAFCYRTSPRSGNSMTDFSLSVVKSLTVPSSGPFLTLSLALTTTV